MNETIILDAEVSEVNTHSDVVKPSQELMKTVIHKLNEKGEVNLAVISAEEKAKYDQLNKSLVVSDINSIANYGSDLQNTMSKYSNDFLTAVRASKTGEVGELVNGLLGELDFIDVDDLKTPSKFKQLIRQIPLLKKMVTSVDKIFKKYDSIAKNVDDISKKISVTRLSSLRDNNALQVMFDNNIVYGKQIEELIIAGKLKLEEVDDNINTMLSNSQDYEAHNIQDAQEFRNNLDRRLNDMITLHYVMKQSLPQIRTVQYNNVAIADKAQSIIATTIPVWKNQLSIAVALYNQKANIEAHRKISDTTNMILKKNAEMLKLNSIDVARENERSVVDVETLKKTTEDLITTVREVKQIHEEGTARRRAAEIEIAKLGKELEANMTAIGSNSSHKYLS